MLDHILEYISGGKLPTQHRDLKSISKMNNPLVKFRILFRLFMVHPIKRRLAKLYVAFLRKFFGLTVVGITGSAGKTTTKEMLASILTESGRVVSSYKNIDPIFNIPTSILRCRPSTKYLVLEMGVEFPGEMDFYLWLVRPDIAVITNIYATHLEFFLNEEGVLKEKIKLVKNLYGNGVAVLNHDNKYLADTKLKSRTLWFGDTQEVSATVDSISAENTIFTLNYQKNRKKIILPVMGTQFVENALAASSVAIILGLDMDKIAAGLGKFKSSDHRMKVLNFPNDITVFDDTYNNNPSAAMSAIKNFMELDKKKKKLVVFGDMLELGDKSVQYHKQVGQYMNSFKLDKLVCVGNLAKYTGGSVNIKDVYYAADASKATRILEKITDSNTDILIKGSRSIHLDSLVDQLSF